MTSRGDWLFQWKLPSRGRDVALNHAVEFMRLTLNYEGPLHAASAGNTRADEKHNIRKVFHAQLAELWATAPHLNSLVSRFLNPDQHPYSASHPVYTSTIGQFSFLPLVTERLAAICELDILFLRRQPIGKLVFNQGGDIDNRIKVLFDALRMPTQEKEIPPTAAPDETERPFFYSLLEDDGLITSFRVESERLLGPVEPDSAANVKLVVRATIKVHKLTYWNMGLGETI